MLSELADVTYKCSTYYHPDVERGFRYDDPEVRSTGHKNRLLLSERDKPRRPAQIADDLPSERERETTIFGP